MAPPASHRGTIGLTNNPSETGQAVDAAIGLSTLAARAPAFVLAAVVAGGLVGGTLYYLREHDAEV